MRPRRPLAEGPGCGCEAGPDERTRGGSSGPRRPLRPSPFEALGQPRTQLVPSPFEGLAERRAAARATGASGNRSSVPAQPDAPRGRILPDPFAAKRRPGRARSRSAREVGGYSVLQTTTGLTASTGGAKDETTFTSVVLAVHYFYDDEETDETRGARAVLRLNLPDSLGSQSAPVGVVLFVNGTKATGVGCALQTQESADRYPTGAVGDDDVAASALAAGRDILIFDREGSPFGRSGDPMVTIQFNNPSFGKATGCAADFQSTGNPLYAGTTPDNPDGDDWCGYMARAATEAVVQAAYLYLADEFGLDQADTRLMVVSFSNGCTCATHWMTSTDIDVHAYIDVEGPTDSYEQLAIAEIDDFFGVYEAELAGEVEACRDAYGRVSLPTPFDIERWVRGRELPGACGGKQKFAAAYRYYGRPPQDWAREARFVYNAYSASGQDWWPSGASLDDCHDGVCEKNTEAYDPAVLGRLDRFWTVRKTLEHLAWRKGAYVRVQSVSDHVQPRHYHNRHAWRALEAALDLCSAGYSDVYYVDGDYLADAASLSPGTRAGAEPPPYTTAIGVDPDDLSTYVDFPTVRDKWAVEVDLVRWAFEKDPADFARGP